MSNKNKNKNGVVYSTNPDFQYENYGDEELETLSPSQQTLYVRREVRNGIHGEALYRFDHRGLATYAGFRFVRVFRFA